MSAATVSVSHLRAEQARLAGLAAEEEVDAVVGPAGHVCVHEASHPEAVHHLGGGAGVVWGRGGWRGGRGGREGHERPWEGGVTRAESRRDGETVGASKGSGNERCSSMKHAP